jgi:chromosome segregation ATPase
MEVKDILEPLAYLILVVLGGAVTELRQRRKGAPWRERTRLLEGRLDTLRKDRQDDLAVIDHLQKRVDKLAHYEELYNTLKEAHDGLKLDHEALKAKFEAKVTAWKEVTDSLNNERARTAELERELLHAVRNGHVPECTPEPVEMADSAAEQEQSNGE